MASKTEALSRKERRKQERKSKKRRRDVIPPSCVKSETTKPTELKKKAKRPSLPKEKEQTRKTKSRPSSTRKEKDPYVGVDSRLVEALRRDDEEILELERKLGVKQSNKDKLHKEYSKNEGFGDDFGTFLDDLDNVLKRVSNHEEGSVEESESDDADCPTQPPETTIVDRSTAAAIQNDDEEIKALEAKLGFHKPKEKNKLYKEYSKQDGFGEDFGDFLDDLDRVVTRVANDRNNEIYNKKVMEDYDEDKSSSEGSARDEEGESSDGEELVPMKDAQEMYSDDEESMIDIMDEVASTDGDDFESPGSEASGSDPPSDDSGNDTSESKQGNDHESSTYHPTKGEDIYGNSLDSKTNSSKKRKYIPPHLRKSKGSNEDDDGEKKAAIRRCLNNALNRLSGDTLISVAQQVAKVFSSFPTQLVHEMIYNNTQDACIDMPMLMTGLVPTYVACLVGVHVQTPETVQVGEALIEYVTVDLWKALAEAREEKRKNSSDPSNEVTQKRACNVLLVLCYLYNYGMVHCSFMYDVIRHLIENFAEIDVECILILLSHCGRSLRSDDPSSLKEIVLLVTKQQAKGAGKEVPSSRTEYMISAIQDHVASAFW